ncbi:unnamed protein product [Gadus morhua 'NCC']
MDPSFPADLLQRYANERRCSRTHCRRTLWYTVFSVPILCRGGLELSGARPSEDNLVPKVKAPLDRFSAISPRSCGG